MTTPTPKRVCEHRVRVNRGEAERLRRKARNLWPTREVSVFGLALLPKARMWVTICVW